MIDAGTQFATDLKPGDTLALFGDLGSGKTRFTKGLAKGLGITQEITSPTFALVQKYSTAQIGELVHVDLYRLKKSEEVDSLGLTEEIENPDSIVVIEWPNLIEHTLPPNAIKLYFSHTKNAPTDNSREVRVDYPN